MNLTDGNGRPLTRDEFINSLGPVTMSLPAPAAGGVYQVLSAPARPLVAGDIRLSPAASARRFLTDGYAAGRTMTPLERARVRWGRAELLEGER